MELSELLKERRKLSNLTQADLAKKAGVGLRLIREIEQGKESFRMDKVNQVLKLFGYELGPVALNREQLIPTYLLNVSNEVQTSPTEYEFDVYIMRTGTMQLELASLQFGLGFDITALNGGTLTPSIVKGTSDFPSNLEPERVNFGTTTFAIGGVTYRFFNCAARSAPGPGKGLIITDVGNCPNKGMRVARYKLTNSVPWTPNSHMNHQWSVSVGSSRTNTLVNAYVGTIITNISAGVQVASNINYNLAGSCAKNIILNPGSTNEKS